MFKLFRQILDDNSNISSALEDLKICGYDIPEGTVVMANFWAASMNVRDWKNPEEFNPYRFLNDDGITLKPRPQCYIPFSVGKSLTENAVLERRHPGA